MWPLCNCSCRVEQVPLPPPSVPYPCRDTQVAPFSEWRRLHPAVYGPFDVRERTAADTGHMASKPRAAGLPVSEPERLPWASSHTEQSTWSHVYLSPEKPPALTKFLLKTGNSVKKADDVCNIPQVWKVITRQQSLSLWSKRGTVLHDNKTGVSKTDVTKDGTANTCSLDETPANRKKNKIYIYICVCSIYIKTEREKLNMDDWLLSLNPPY